MTPLETLAATDTVDNVVVFVSDSFRYDMLPRGVKQRGVYTKAVAPSTFTGISVPSMFSGRFPSEHRVWSFNHSLEHEPVLFRGRNSGYNADTVWTHLDPTEKPPVTVLNTSPGDPVAELEPPFVYVEHDKGGHSPYGFSFDECESTPTFYDEYIDSTTEIEGLYRRSVERSIDRFDGLIERLKRRDIFENTLVLFTSDHGELLGESKYGTSFEHGQPLTPPLVYVPMIFLGAGLPKNYELETTLSGIDVAPTALSAQGRPVPKRMSGHDLWGAQDPERELRCEYMATRTIRNRERTVYGGTSIWDDNGGVVKHVGNRAMRVTYAHYYHYHAAPFAPYVTPSPTTETQLLKLYGPSKITYGDPAVSSSKIAGLPSRFLKSAPSQNNFDREQLERLGYLE